MNRHELDGFRLPPWAEFATDSPLRCHLCGALICTALAAAIVAIFSHHPPEPVEGIDPREARALVENAPQWRRLYHLQYSRAVNLDHDVEDISGWLPRSVNWIDFERNLRELASQHDVTLHAVGHVPQPTGSRAGVVIANCELTSTFPQLCRLLRELSEAELVSSCSELSVKRIEPTVASEPALCRCEVELRIPFAADGTAAGNLIAGASHHAH